MNKFLMGFCAVLLIAVCLTGKNIQSNKFEVYQVEDLILCEKTHGDIVFYTDNKERIRIAEDGTFYVGNKVLGKDQEIYSSFRDWIINNIGHVKVK